MPFYRAENFVLRPWLWELDTAELYQYNSPFLLSLQQLPVGGDLYVQGQLHIHELLVLFELQSHVVLGPLQSQLQVPDASLGILHGPLPPLLRFGYLALKVGTLKR